MNFIFFGTRKETGYCKPGNEKFGFHKMKGIPRQAEKLLVSQKGTFSVELDLLRYYVEVKLSVLNELFLTSAFEKLHALV